MGTAVVDTDDDATQQIEKHLEAVIAHKDAIGRWSVTASGRRRADSAADMGVARGAVDEPFDSVLDAAVADFARRLKVVT